MSTIWKGKRFAVRSTAEAGQYFLIRPISGAVLDKFDDLATAMAVATYCDARGGSYTAPIRKEAKEYASRLILVDDDHFTWWYDEFMSKAEGAALMSTFEVAQFAWNEAVSRILRIGGAA